MEDVQILAVEPPCRPGWGGIGQRVDIELNKRSIEWDLSTQRLLLTLSDAFSFQVERFDLWANCQYYSELGDAARKSAAARAVEASPPDACGQEVSLTPVRSEELGDATAVGAPEVSSPPEVALPAVLPPEVSPSAVVSPEAPQPEVLPPQVSSPEAHAPEVGAQQASATHSPPVQNAAQHNTPQAALSSPVAMPGTGFRYLEIASAPPVLPGQNTMPRLELGSPVRLFAQSMQLQEQLDESCEPADPVLQEEETHNASSVSPQCAPTPQVVRPPKLSIRTPVEGVPELRHSALRDTPSRSTAPLITLRPHTHVEGVPETNVHLPLPRQAAVRGTSSASTALTPPSQIEGVPELHMSAWAPPAQPRLSATEDSVGNARMSSMDSQRDASRTTTSQHVSDAPQRSTAQGSVEHNAPALSPDPIHQLSLHTCSPPRSRITHPTPTPSQAYIIPDHPVLLNSKPSPVLSPRSRLIRESADGVDSQQQANAEQPELTPEPQAIPFRLPNSGENSRENSSRPSTAEGSISLNGDAALAASAGAQTDRVSPCPDSAAEAQHTLMPAPPGSVGDMLPPMSAQAWFQRPSGLTPEGYVSVAVGTTPINSDLALDSMGATPAASSMEPKAVEAAPEISFLGLVGHNADDQGDCSDGMDSDGCDDIPEDPLATPPDEHVSTQHEIPRSSHAAQVAARPALIPRHVNKSYTRQSLQICPETQEAQQFVPSAVPSTVAPKSILKTAKLPSTAGCSSAMKRPRHSGQENLSSGGTVMDTRTPHFQLPLSGANQHFSGFSGQHSVDSDEHMSQSEHMSQGRSEGNEGAEEEAGTSSGKNRSRGARSLMSKHLRRKSLALAGTKEVDGRRVSTRKKMKPLRWWCSETKTYCRKHQSLPTVQAVIRTEQKSAQYRGLKNPADSFQAHMEAWDTK